MFFMSTLFMFVNEPFIQVSLLAKKNGHTVAGFLQVRVDSDLKEICSIPGGRSSLSLFTGSDVFGA